GVLSWKKLAGTYDLLSRNPADYSAACVYIAGSVVRDFGTEIVDASTGRPARGTWDRFATLVIAVILIFVVGAWVAIVSPLNYLVTLFAGAPARLFRQTEVTDVSVDISHTSLSPDLTDDVRL